MASKIFNDFQGNTIRIGGVCYTYTNETVSTVNSDPSEIDETYASCLECELDESSSFSSGSESSESINNFSTSSSSDSSESFLNESSESSDGIIIGDCVSPCDLTVQFKTVNSGKQVKLQVYDGTGLILDTGFIVTVPLGSFVTYNFTDLECPITVCVEPETDGSWELIINGCGMDIHARGTTGKCFESPSLQSSSSSDLSESSSSESGGGGAPLEKVNCCINCGISSSDNRVHPRVKTTMCWTDTDVTKSWRGATWTNGESKIMCPSQYSTQQGGTGTQHEKWTQQPAYGNGIKLFHVVGYNKVRVVLVGAFGAYMYVRDVNGVPSTYSNTGVSAYSPTTGQINSPNASATPVQIRDNQFGFMTTTAGVTIKWEAIEGNAIGTDTWASWVATDLTYKATIGNEGCP